MDTQLAKGPCQQGDQGDKSRHRTSVRSAWSAELIELYATRFEQLVRAADRIVWDRSVAEDCVQEAFIGFHAKGVSPKPGCEAAYLRSMVRNAAITKLRKQARLSDDSEMDSRPGLSAEENALRRMGSSELARAITGLPGRQAEALRYQLVGFSVGETAAAMSCSIGSVKAHRFRGAAALRRSVAA